MKGIAIAAIAAGIVSMFMLEERTTFRDKVDGGWRECVYTGGDSAACVNPDGTEIVLVLSPKTVNYLQGKLARGE